MKSLIVYLIGFFVHVISAKEYSYEEYWRIKALTASMVTADGNNTIPFVLPYKTDTACVQETVNDGDYLPAIKNCSVYYTLDDNKVNLISGIWDVFKTGWDAFTWIKGSGSATVVEPKAKDPDCVITTHARGFSWFLNKWFGQVAVHIDMDFGEVSKELYATVNDPNEGDTFKWSQTKHNLKSSGVKSMALWTVAYDCINWVHFSCNERVLGSPSSKADFTLGAAWYGWFISDKKDGPGFATQSCGPRSTGRKMTGSTKAGYLVLLNGAFYCAADDMDCKWRNLRFIEAGYPGVQN